MAQEAAGYRRDVVVVEDFEPTRRMLERMLESAGYAVESFSSATDALERCVRKPPSLIVTDMIMPFFDGLSFVRALRGRRETAHVPVMVATAVESPEQERAALDAGAQSLLLKPFRKEVLIAKAKELLS